VLFTEWKRKGGSQGAPVGKRSIHKMGHEILKTTREKSKGPAARKAERSRWKRKPSDALQPLLM